MTNQQAYLSRGGGWGDLWNIDKTPGSEKDEFVHSEYTLVNCNPKDTQEQNNEGGQTSPEAGCPTLLVERVRTDTVCLGAVIV